MIAGTYTLIIDGHETNFPTFFEACIQAYVLYNVTKGETKGNFKRNTILRLLTNENGTPMTYDLVFEDCITLCARISFKDLLDAREEGLEMLPDKSDQIHVKMAATFIAFHQELLASGRDVRISLIKFIG